MQEAAALDCGGPFLLPDGKPTPMEMPTQPPSHAAASALSLSVQ